MPANTSFIAKTSIIVGPPLARASPTPRRPLAPQSFRSLVLGKAATPGQARGKSSPATANREAVAGEDFPDRKSTRLNSSHQIISYAVFCLKNNHTHHHP